MNCVEVNFFLIYIDNLITERYPPQLGICAYKLCLLRDIATKKDEQKCISSNRKQFPCKLPVS